MVIVGIDFGAKRSGKTALAIQDGSSIRLYQSTNKQDSDAFILEHLQDLKPGLIGIDAPLSLPGVYSDIPGCSDYHYRAADREAGAMSPMFLGGLTARAMSLTQVLKSRGWEVVETYPAMQARRLKLYIHFYKKTNEALATCTTMIQRELNEPVIPENWHQFDALLAFIGANRYRASTHNSLGNNTEGVIVY